MGCFPPTSFFKAVTSFKIQYESLSRLLSGIWESLVGRERSQGLERKPGLFQRDYNPAQLYPYLCKFVFLLSSVIIYHKRKISVVSAIIMSCTVRETENSTTQSQTPRMLQSHSLWYMPAFSIFFLQYIIN